MDGGMRLLQAINAKEVVIYSHTCSVERKVHDMQQNYVFSIEKAVDVVEGEMKTLLLVDVDGRKVIFPRKERIKTIIEFFYKAYEGEGARKLHERISQNYAGITRTKDIQKFLNENPEHCRRNPIFKNKPPLQPIVSHVPYSRHQIDSVSFEKDP